MSEIIIEEINVEWLKLFHSYWSVMFSYSIPDADIQRCQWFLKPKRYQKQLEETHELIKNMGLS